MVADKDTAEERLLRLIENPSVAHATAGGPSVQRAKDKWRGFLAGMKRRPSYRRRPSEDEFLERIRFVTRFLWIALLLLAGYVMKDMLVPYHKPEAAPAPAVSRTVPPPASDSLPAKPDNYLKPMSVYISAADSRNPFRPASGVKAVEPVHAAQAASGQLETLTQSLKVVGIDRSGTPRALIEDSKDNKTYFVGIGEQVGTMTVKKITETGVVLGLEGKEIELTY